MASLAPYLNPSANLPMPIVANATIYARNTMIATVLGGLVGLGLGAFIGHKVSPGAGTAIGAAGGGLVAGGATYVIAGSAYSAMLAQQMAQAVAQP